MKEVAAHAGVSTMTVSNVINGTSKVAPELRERVLRAIKDLKYQPSVIARSLRTKRTHSIGMIMPDITNPFFPAVVRGAEDVLNQHGYTLIICNSDSDTQKEERYYRTLVARRVDGLFLIASATTHAPEYLLNHDLRAIPVVFIDRFYNGVRADAVFSDNMGGSFRAVNHLFACGHRRIGIITGPFELENSKMRLEGYKRSLALHHVKIDNRLIREGEYHARSGYEQTKALLSLEPRPTALFVSNAPMTYGCLRAIREAKIKCPEELALISFDDMEWFEVSYPSISGVAQDAYGLGKTAAQLLVKRLLGELTRPPRHKTLKTTLVLRESTKWHLNGARLA
jgi:LacI family transcriptional regulator